MDADKFAFCRHRRVRKWERENLGLGKAGRKKGGLKYLRHSHFVSVAGPGEDAIWGWVIDSACSLSIRGESGDGTNTTEAEDNGTLYALYTVMS